MNTRSTHSFFGWLLLGLLAFSVSIRAAEPAAPDFKEVLQVVRDNLAGATDDSLNRASVEGLLLALKGRVQLGATNDASATNAVGPLTRQEVFDGGVGYLRVARLAAGLETNVADAVRELNATNKLAGLVLDLRFAGGDDYATAARVVDLFLSKEMPLMNANQGLVSSVEKTNAIRLPVVALVNGETAEAAEALAAMLRQTGVGLVLGNRTAGRAAVMREFKLSSGQTLRVAVAPVLMGDAKPVPSTGVVPDIEVALKLDEERAFYADPLQANGNGSSTNGVRSARRPRVSEADLVREKRGELDAESLAAAREKTPTAPAVADPVLSRAIDLLKGLAVVRSGRF